MEHRRWYHMVAGIAFSLAIWGGAAPAGAAPPDPAAAATAYLETRAAAIASPDPAAALAPWLGRGTQLAITECLVARGAARRAVQLGHAVKSVDSETTVSGVTMSESGHAATVNAHVVSTVVWRSPSGIPGSEASGLDHAVSLELTGDTWRVTGDAYTDTLTPAYLEAAGASALRVSAAARLLEAGASTSRPPSTGRSCQGARQTTRRRYTGVLTYDRDAAREYADRYALSYNGRFVRFGADCANFASQCGSAGNMPKTWGDYADGWWYDGRGTSSPSDDRYSMSWINVTKQIAFWNGYRTDWVSSISGLGKGDFVYYDWTGDGLWDHVAVLAGANSAGQKVVDAHTTDYYHVYWKMGYSSTKYRFARVRAYWIV